MTTSPLLLSKVDSPNSEDSTTKDPGEPAESASEPQAEVTNQSNTTGTLSLLRQGLEDGSQPPDAIIRAAAESARALTGADGVALALRSKGAIVCRARGGELAPSLGAQLNIQSGISGECVRSATIQLCHDAATDARVDPEVCQAMGISSIVAVPLRGVAGIAGILEAFSSRAQAFGEEEIEYLREVAMIAETAYEKERVAEEEAALKPARLLPTLFTRTAATSKEKEIEPSAHEAAPATQNEAPEGRGTRLLPRQYWAVGIAAVALLLFLGVWLSWRGQSSELADAKNKNAFPGAGAVTPSQPVTASPDIDPIAKTVRVDASHRPGSGTLRKAAEIERTSDAPNRNPASSSGNSNAGIPDEVANRTSPAANVGSNAALLMDSPPSVTIAAEDTDHQLNGLIYDSKPMPAIDVKVSQGVTPASLVHKVDPMYPLQARLQRISGSVDLEITIGEDGVVHNVKQISGEPILVTAAVDAVRKWRYTPVLLNGKPISSEKRMTIVFRQP